jgi:hypothetical protein
MKAMNLDQVKFMVKCALTKSIYDAKFNLGRAWVHDQLTEQQYEAADRELSNADTLMTIAINNAESQSEIDDIVADLEKHLSNVVVRLGLPCRF